ESWTALALGFGTTVFPQEVLVLPPVPIVGPVPAAARVNASVVPITLPVADSEYMVTAQFTTLTGDVVQLAAVASLVTFPVAPPTPLTASTLRVNRPMQRDQPASEDVELRWPRLSGTLRPHQYALGGIIDNTPTILNDPRPGTNTGFKPYIPARP